MANPASGKQPAVWNMSLSHANVSPTCRLRAGRATISLLRTAPVRGKRRGIGRRESRRAEKYVSRPPHHLNSSAAAVWCHVRRRAIPFSRPMIPVHPSAFVLLSRLLLDRDRDFENLETSCTPLLAGSLNQPARGVRARRLLALPRSLLLFVATWLGRGLRRRTLRPVYATRFFGLFGDGGKISPRLSPHQTT